MSHHAGLAIRISTVALSLVMLLAGWSSALRPAVAQDDLTIRVADAFSTDGDAGLADTRYVWSVGEGEGSWRVSIVGPADERVSLELASSDGTVIDGTRATGEAHLFDLVLQPGEFELIVKRSNRERLPFTLSSELQATVFDPEPNDIVADAAPIAIGAAMTGRLADANGDIDHFWFEVPAGATDLIDVRLDSPEGVGRVLCLLDDSEMERQCRSGAQGLQLTDLALDPGEYILRVRGSTDPDAPYSLSVGSGNERRPDYEAEPNDDSATASPIDAALGVGGRSSRDDHDYFEVLIEGEPQLWRWQASGTDVREFDWVGGGGAVIESSAPPAAGAAAVLDDLFLGPGTHRFHIRTMGGDYRIDGSPLGPPHPDAEREPNSDPLRAEPYVIDTRFIGRLSTKDDLDHLRFTLAASENLRLRLVQGAESDIDVQLSSAGATLHRTWAEVPGEPIDISFRLEGGDYLVRLAPRVPNDEPYELTIERLDPFLDITDAEPNGNVQQARAVPASLVWSGDGGGSRDTDYYRLPPLELTADVTVSFSDEAQIPRLWAGSDGKDRVDLAQGEPGEYLATDVPAATPLFLEITALGPYQAMVESSGWDPQDPPADPAIAASLGLDSDVVAAYWPNAQRVQGALMLRNEGAEPVSLVLDATSSHYAWQPKLAQSAVSLEPGAQASVDVTVEIAADAWAGVPVRVSIVARQPGGGAVTTFAQLAATPEADPVESHLAWPIPDELLGGLNVAGAALGGIPRGDVHPDREPFLYDGVTTAGGGFGLSINEYPVEFVVDLAGEAPVAVAGTIINPLARGSQLAQTPDTFELLLSTDGGTWTSVLSGSLSPLGIEQAFVLPEPVEATHAMLRIHALKTGSSRTLSLGEWKVIAQPGAEPDEMPRNIADPVRGGRVVRRGDRTTSFGYQTEALAGDSKRLQIGLEANAPAFSMVVGFQDGRAALIEELRWADPKGSTPDRRLDRLDVEISIVSPLGPWSESREWLLPRDASGTVEALAFDTPTWARYIRLSTELPEGTRVLELPAAVEVIEHAGADYRSVLGEWGQHSPLGPMEWLAPSEGIAAQPGIDAGDTQAEATFLELGTTRTEQAEILSDVDWYRIEVPRDDNTLTLDLDGAPSVGVGVTLFDAAGIEQPLLEIPAAGGAVSYEAVVEPGATYDLLVQQPPFNIVFTFDTSGSMGPFLEAVTEGMREFAADITPGREGAHIVPFEQSALLEDWEDRPYVLVDAVNNLDLRLGQSSGAIFSMLNASELLGARPGTRAILIVTDAETDGFDLLPATWDSLERSQAVVYSVHIGGESHPLETRNLMQSWANANGGRYAYPVTQADVDRAFERMSTQLRRPATYSVVANANAVNRTPALLSVVAPEGLPVALAPGVGVEIILDTSGSMRNRLDGIRRIEIAKASLRSLFGDVLAEGVPVAVRTFGGQGKAKKARCDTRLIQRLAPLEKTKALKLVKKLSAAKKVRTPLAAAIAAVADDLATVEGTRLVVLVTDGDETCGGDPGAAIETLKASGIDVNVNIVGFALEDESLKEQMAAWARAGGGSYYDASIADELALSLTQALAAPFRVYRVDGDEPLANGVVGGAGALLDPGTYRVEVLIDPAVVFDAVIIKGGMDVSLPLPVSEEIEGG